MNSTSAVKDIIHAYLKEQDLAEQFTLVDAKEPVEGAPIDLVFDARLVNVRPNADLLTNNAYVRNVINTFYGLKDALKTTGIAAEVKIRKISLKGSLISARSLLGVCAKDNKTFLISSDLLEHIRAVNLSKTEASSLGLEKVYSFTSLLKLKLDFCKNITEVLAPKVICPSLQTLSLVGTAMKLKAGWQKKLTKKFPNLTCIDVTLGKNVAKSPGFLDQITLSTCVDARIYVPCGHIFSNASRVDKLKPCALCKSEITHTYRVTKHITRFEKQSNNTWQSTVVDVKRKPLQDGQIYFHPPCQQFYNGDTLKAIYGENILKQIAKTDAVCVGCLQCGKQKTLQGLFKAFPVLTEKREDEKSQNLSMLAQPCYIDESL